jgi:23S rRNA pseudouridine1911/1915/1917 synthase
VTSAWEPRILAEAAGWLAVDKPAMMLCHPTRPGQSDTLLDWLRTRVGGDFLAPVNRLDRETSGVVLVARTREVAAELGKRWMRREVAKEYRALVWGVVLRDRGVVDAPLAGAAALGLSDISVKQMVKAGGQPACTEWWVERRWRGFTRLRLRAHTGRLHQVRVHLAHAGHPVVGDKIYGPDDRLYLEVARAGWMEWMRERLVLPRHALHASRLRFEQGDGRHDVGAPWPGDLALFEQGLAGNRERER